ARSSTGGAQPERAARTALPADKPDAARDRARALRIGLNGQHTPAQHLLQARCAQSLLRRHARARAPAPLNHQVANIAEVARAPAAQSSDSDDAGSASRAAE